MASELSLIQAFIAPFRPSASPGGPGDDCAVWAGKGPLCLTTDAVVEDVHFSFPSFTLEDVGHKALAVNLSDLAAMGCKPAWFLCALSLPKTFGIREVNRLARGMARLARKYKTRLLGGNVTSAEKLSVTLTAAGVVGHRPILRSTGREGDLVYVSGTLGDARLGLARLSQAPRSSEAMRQRRPVPRVRLGLIAARFASAAIDISDGFAHDLRHVCESSRVGAHIELARLPLSRAVRRAFASADDAASFAAAGGEDYELLLAIPEAKQNAFERECIRVGERVTRVGTLTKGRRLVLVSAQGRRLSPPAGFDHFANAHRKRRIDVSVP